MDVLVEEAFRTPLKVWAKAEKRGAGMIRKVREETSQAKPILVVPRHRQRILQP